MQHLADLLAALPLPRAEAPEPPPQVEPELVHDLGADMPAGHLHVWGGPTGGGKTAFLLSLLHGAALKGRGVVYASYDLPVETLALRLLAMAAGVDAGALAEGRLEAQAARHAGRLRAALQSVPFLLLPARGFSVSSLEDRLVRMPFRPEVLAVDYLQAVVRDPSTDAGSTLRELSALATRLHVAVVCAVRMEPALEESELPLHGLPSEGADRVGWIAPAGGSGACRAEVLQNRYGARPTVPLTLDPANGALHPAAR